MIHVPLEQRVQHARRVDAGATSVISIA